jgi:hypothetical protein
MFQKLNIILHFELNILHISHTSIIYELLQMYILNERTKLITM